MSINQLHCFLLFEHIIDRVQERRDICNQSPIQTLSVYPVSIQSLFSILYSVHPVHPVHPVRQSLSVFRRLFRPHLVSCPKPCPPSHTLFPRRLFFSRSNRRQRNIDTNNTDRNITDNALFNRRQAWQGRRRGPVEFALPIGQAAGTSRLLRFFPVCLSVCLSN